MQPPKEEDNRLGEEDEEMEEEAELTEKEKQANNQKLIANVKKNEYDEVERLIRKKADVNYEEQNKKKWNPLIWACCLGHGKIVRLLLSKGAAAQYLEEKPELRNVVMGATKEMRVSPLHWACFKGHLEIVQLLLKAGLHWEDIDSCGNNSVMLAAAGNFPDIFKKFLQLGVALDCKNSRGHTALDLTTHPQIKALILAHQQAENCAVSNQPFREKQVKHWCWVSNKFVSGQNFHVEWSLRELQATEKEELDGRSSTCWQAAQQMEKELTDAMDSRDEARLRKTMGLYEDKNSQLDIVFLQKCKDLLHLLEVQNQILGYVRSLDKVDNYKVILKSVNKIHQMLKDASHLSIENHVIQAAKTTIQRLNAQRNLRFEIDNIDTSSATREGVSKLEDIYSDAETKSVSTEYLEVAGDIKEKMNRSIKVQDLYQMFLDYPQRPDPYPEPLVIDFKTKKPLDPETKKPTDPANLLPKKKKKKDPKFVVPEWAADLKEMNDRIKEEEELLGLREELNLTDDFCKKVEETIVLMKRESRYRKDMDTLQAMVDENNKKKK